MTRKPVKKIMTSVDKEQMKRKHAMSTMLNDVEYDAIARYCKQYKIRNKSKMLRNMIFMTIFKDYDRDYPTLFDRQVLADLVVERR